MIRFLLAGMILLTGGAAHAQMPPEIEARLPPPYFRAYVIAVCAASEDITDDCMNEGLRNAAFALSEMYLRAYRGQMNWNSLRIRFPLGWVEASQMRFLRDVERKGVELANEKIARDLTPGATERLDNWRASALSEAASGANWLHDWSEFRHDFAPSHVARQLAQADIRR